jgi:hypothetical protein
LPYDNNISWSSLSCSFLHPYITLSLLGPDIFSSASRNITSKVWGRSLIS